MNTLLNFYLALQARFLESFLVGKGGDDCGQKEKKEEEVRDFLTDKSGVLKAHRFLLPLLKEKTAEMEPL